MNTTNDCSLIFEMTFTVPDDVTAAQVYGAALCLPGALANELEQRHISIRIINTKYSLDARQSIRTEFPQPKPYLGD
jgi:hypothetical protein